MNRDTGEEGQLDRILREIDRLEHAPGKHLSIQIDNDLRAMVRAAAASGGTASVTIKFTARLKGELIELAGTSTAKLPPHPTPSVRLYTNDDGDLFDHNPHHVKSALPGVDVKTTRRVARADTTESAPIPETPSNAKKGN